MVSPESDKALADLDRTTYLNIVPVNKKPTQTFLLSFQCSMTGDCQELTDF